MVQPINYTLPQADPFAGVMQGLRLGATIDEIQAARAQQALQMEAQREKSALQRQAVDQAAANEAELRQLQGVPFEGMTRQQQLRLMQLTNSEASRAFIAREMERMPAAMVESRLRRSGSIVNALRMNPEIGIKLLRESAEVEQDPEQKKAYETAAGVAEQNPLLAARMIHGMMDLVGTGDEKAKRSADAVVNFLDRAGVPLYPKEPGKPMIVPPESTVLQDGKPIFTAPRRSQLLSPEEETQKARIAAAGRTPPAPRDEKDDPRTVVAFRETDAAGNVTMLNKFGEVITPTAPVRGKPSATFEKTTAQRKQLGLDLDRAIVELTDATKKGGLIDQSTGSGAGRLVDIGAGFIGQATPGAIAGGKLAPIADLVLKMVPRFEGPQSDKDTTSYKEAAGQLANTALPNEVRKQAGLEILRLMKARKGQFVSAEMAAEGVGAAPAPAGNFPAPPQAAIDALKAGRGTDAQFDAVFGPGSAARARGR